MKYFLYLALLPVAQGFAPTSSQTASPRLTRHNNGEMHTSPNRQYIMDKNQCSALSGMKRPILDTVATTLFKLETSRVENSSEMDDQGRMGEPMEWSESTSVANKFSEAIASNSIGYQFKQFVADLVAGEYDEEAVTASVDAFINNNKAKAPMFSFGAKKAPAVAMFSFTTCPFCRRAKDYLDEQGIAYTVMELDELDGNEGNAIRAVLGKKVKRTSVPSIFIGGNYVGGCNDGPGLLPLGESGELAKLLQRSDRKSVV